MKLAKLVLLVFCLAVATSAQSHNVERIDVRSTWGGLGEPQESSVTIVRKGTYYVAGGKRIEAAKIDALLQALSEPDLDKPFLDNLGMTQAWLIANAQKCVNDCINGYIFRANRDQKQLFLTKYTDQQFVQETIEGIFRSHWTDDFPRFEVVIRYSEGDDTRIFSDSQFPFMIPWQVAFGDKERTTFNARISMALASFLPSKFTNSRRLEATGFAETLAATVLRRTEAEWKRLEVMEKFNDVVETFAKEYTIVSMELNSNHDSDFGTPWNTKPAPEKNLHILLRKEDFPVGFALKLILPIENGKVQNIDSFKERIGSYLRSLNSIPWLRDFIETGGKPVWLRFVKNRSFSEKGMRTFADDMNAVRKPHMVAEVESVQDQVVALSIGGGLEYYQSFWLILPNGRSVVWRHYNASPLPQLTLTGKECAQPRSNTTPCVGALISPEGTIIEE